jgi:hypothetical protein
LGWLPWVAFIVVAGVVGGTAGATGVFGREIDGVTVASSTAIVSDSATAYSCPGGSVVGSVAEGSRVLAIKRSEDSAYLAVRDPQDIRSTVWLDRAVVQVDAGLDVSTLPTGACPVVTIPKPVVVAPAPPVEVDDTTAPEILNAGAAPGTITIQGYSAYCGVDQSVVSVTATDDVEVTSVTATWAGGRAALSQSGDTWKFVFSNPADDSYSVVMTAQDSAGNVSAPVTVKVVVTQCLI